MTSGSLPKRDKNSTGHTSSTAAHREDTPSATHRATPSTRLMDSISCLPQYWLMRTEDPLWTPKMNICTANRGMLARVTAAMGASPSMPTIKVSAMPRVLVIRFCSTMGMASNTTCL